MSSHHPKLDVLRTSLRRALPGVGSAHVAEAVARALGFRTNAAFLASLRDGAEPDWCLDGPALVVALDGLGHPGVDPFVISPCLPSRSSWHYLDRDEALTPGSSFPAFSAYVLANQSLLATVVSQVFPHRFAPPATGDMAWPSRGDLEGWTQVSHDGLMLGVGKGDLDAMRRRIVGWCLLVSVTADALGLAIRDEADFVPVRQVALGGWKAAFRSGPVPSRRAWDDEADHDGALPSLRLPWPGAMGASMHATSAFRFARAAGSSDVRWMPDAPSGRRTLLSVHGHWVELPDDPALETAMWPLLASGHMETSCGIPGMEDTDGRLRIQIDAYPQGRVVTMRTLYLEMTPVRLGEGVGEGMGRRSTRP